MSRDSVVQSILSRYVRYAFTKPLRILAISAVVLAVSLYLSGHLEFRGSFLELLPQSAREVKDLTRVSQKAGGDGYLVFVVTGGTPEQRRRFAEAVVPRLEKLPDVRYVEYRYPIDFFKKRALWLLPTEKLRALRKDLAARIHLEKERANPLVVELTDDAPPPTLAEIETSTAATRPRANTSRRRTDRSSTSWPSPTASPATWASAAVW